jgi:hypothetical protein
MSGLMNPLYYLVLSAVLIGGWLLFRRWYAVDSQRSLLVLCILLTPIFRLACDDCPCGREVGELAIRPVGICPPFSE